MPVLSLNKANNVAHVFDTFKKLTHFGPQLPNADMLRAVVCCGDHGNVQPGHVQQRC